MADVPENISEEYYQISERILSSFPKYRPALDLFVFDENVGQLLTFARKGTRLSNEQVEEVQAICASESLYVSRSDHPVYAEHIVKQLDLVLVDKNLKNSEVASISIRALQIKLGAFIDQPVRPAYQELHDDLLVVTEYIWNDPGRISLFVDRLFVDEYTLVKHSINSMIVGLWLFLTVTRKEKITRRDFDQAAFALLLKDAGMAKVPPFITGKRTPLKPDEKEKIPPHAFAGYKIMDKLEITNEYMRQACLEHHERLDGSGYPQKNRDISFFGRLTAVADAFTAMIQDRAYAPAKPLIEAARELTREANRFDLAFSGQILASLVSGSFGKISKA